MEKTKFFAVEERSSSNIENHRFSNAVGSEACKIFNFAASKSTILIASWQQIEDLYDLCLHAWIFERLHQFYPKFQNP